MLNLIGSRNGGREEQNYKASFFFVLDFFFFCSIICSLENWVRGIKGVRILENIDHREIYMVEEGNIQY